MVDLFSAIEELSSERRKRHWQSFCRLIPIRIFFERLPLESSHWGGVGSMIPYMQKRIEYLRSLLSLVYGINYLRQRDRIEREIVRWRKESILKKLKSY